MEPAVLILILRLVSAFLLLLFLAALAWFVYQDVRKTAETLNEIRQPVGYLHVVTTELVSIESGERITLVPVTSIGRSSENVVVLDDEYTSNEHALISLHNGRWWLEDLGSRNGTLLNDLQVETAIVVTTGDVVEIGRTRFRVELV